MIVEGIDENGDWNLGIKNDIDAVAQNLNTRLRCIKNDCFFDLEAGISMSNFDNGQQNYLIAEIQSIIINTDQVSILNSFDVNIDTQRQLRINYDVSTSYSENISSTFTL